MMKRAVYVLGVTLAALIACAGLGWGLRGVMLWPAVILHAVTAVWSAACLLRRSET